MATAEAERRAALAERDAVLKKLAALTKALENRDRDNAFSALCGRGLDANPQRFFFAVQNVQLGCLNLNGTPLLHVVERAFPPRCLMGV